MGVQQSRQKERTRLVNQTDLKEQEAKQAAENENVIMFGSNDKVKQAYLQEKGLNIHGQHLNPEHDDALNVVNEKLTSVENFMLTSDQ